MTNYEADSEVFEVATGLALWLEQEASVHLKAVDKFGDPIELSPIEARRLAELLVSLADKLDEGVSTKQR